MITGISDGQLVTRGRHVCPTARVSRQATQLLTQRNPPPVSAKTPGIAPGVFNQPN
jgi:hypothetical protein